jgi:hypothetical protein
MEKRLQLVRAYIGGQGFSTVQDFLRSCGCDADGAVKLERLLHAICVGALPVTEAAPFAGLGDGPKQ